MWVRVKHYYDIDGKMVNRESSINIQSDSDDHPMNYSFPVTYSGKADGIEVTVTLESFHVNSGNVKIKSNDSKITIASGNESIIAKKLDDYMDRETR